MQLSVACTLKRRTGSPIEARTVDLGPGGMAVTTTRPLTPDEVVTFAVPLSSGELLDGRARVLREQAYHVYALRFEGVSGPSLAHSRSSSA